MTDQQQLENDWLRAANSVDTNHLHRKKLIPYQSFNYWLIVKKDQKFHLAGTQRLPIYGGISIAYFPYQDDFFKVNAVDVFFTVKIRI